VKTQTTLHATLHDDLILKGAACELTRQIPNELRQLGDLNRSRVRRLACCDFLGDARRLFRDLLERLHFETVSMGIFFIFAIQSMVTFQ
jgi:hypothetical protein